jgi:uncharacterized protein
LPEHGRLSGWTAPAAARTFGACQCREKDAGGQPAREVVVDLSLAQIGILVATGVVGGIISGFAGVGGGVVMVPVLLVLYGAWGVPKAAIVQAAMGTSLAVGFCSTASSAVRHHRHGRVLWWLVPAIFPASMVCATAGGWLASQIEGRWLQSFLGLALIYAAISLILKRETAGNDRDDATIHRPWWQWTGVGGGVGLFAGLSGLAGGVVLVPALALLGRVPSRYLAGTSSAVVMFTSLAGAVGYIVSGPSPAIGKTFAGYVNVGAAVCLALTAIPGAQIGAWLNRKVGSTWFRRVFSALLLFVSIRLLLTA